MTNSMQIVPSSQPPAQLAPLTLTQLTERVGMIQAAVSSVLTAGIDYAVIPGCEKPSLTQPGAQKLLVLTGLASSFDVAQTDLPGGHREYRVTCSLTAMTGQTVAQGLGVCSTMESRYRYRNGQRKCPKCGKEAIIKGKEEYGGGWICFARRGGCSAKFQDKDKSIIDQQIGRVENADIADVYNTVLKMGAKRALVAAALIATASSGIFTQDMEDITEPGSFSGSDTVTWGGGGGHPSPEPRPANGGEPKNSPPPPSPPPAKPGRRPGPPPVNYESIPEPPGGYEDLPPVPPKPMVPIPNREEVLKDPNLTAFERCRLVYLGVGNDKDLLAARHLVVDSKGDITEPDLAKLRTLDQEVAAELKNIPF